MKKAFQKILSVVLTVIILFSMLSVGALAAVTEFIEGSIAYVWLDNRNLGVYYFDIDKAWSAACEKGHILSRW